MPGSVEDINLIILSRRTPLAGGLPLTVLSSLSPETCLGIMISTKIIMLQNHQEETDLQLIGVGYVEQLLGRSGSVRIGSLGDSLWMRKPSKKVYVLIIFDLREHVK